MSESSKKFYSNCNISMRSSVESVPQPQSYKVDAVPNESITLSASLICNSFLFLANAMKMTKQKEGNVLLDNSFLCIYYSKNTIMLHVIIQHFDEI